MRGWKKLLCAGILGGSLMIGNMAEAGVVTDRLPLNCYADHKVITYNSPGAKSAGYISANVDLIQITQVRGDGWCYGSYPGAGGRRVSRWFKITDVCADAGYTNRSANVRGKQTVYRTRSGGATLGSVSNNEGVIVVADNGSRAQIVYRLDNGTGYKLGWVPSSSVQAPAPVQQSHNPEGNFEGVSSPAANQIRVEGWAADRDNMGTSLRIHVYVGGGLGSGAESYEIVANKSRTDVRSWFARQGISAGEFYGFNNVINVKRTGRQDVYVYAINIGGGNTVELGHKTVDIKARVSPDPQPVMQKKKAVRTVDAYSYSSLQSKIGRVDAGDMITILQESGNAYRVSYPTARGAKIGWVTKDIFKENKQTEFLWPTPGHYKINTKYTYSNGKPHGSRYYYNGRPCGIDIGVPVGTSVLATADGVVTEKKNKGTNSFGKFIVIKHNDGTYSLYAHLSDYSMVNVGQRVNRGTIIAKSGNTGNSTGPHLHFEMSGRDTYQYFKNAGIVS